jgi:hypothetical protein
MTTNTITINSDTIQRAIAQYGNDQAVRILTDSFGPCEGVITLGEFCQMCYDAFGEGWDTNEDGDDLFQLGGRSNVIFRECKSGNPVMETVDMIHWTEVKLYADDMVLDFENNPETIIKAMRSYRTDGSINDYYLNPELDWDGDSDPKNDEIDYTGLDEA